MALIYHWPLNDGSGTTVADAVGNNHGTIYNPTGTLWISESGISALKFNGRIGDATVVPYVKTAKYLTVANFGVGGRFRTTNSGGHTFVGFTYTWAYTPETLDKFLYVGADGRLCASMSDVTNTGQYIFLWSDAVVNDGQWHHGFLQSTPTQVELWLDGALVDSAPMTTATTRYGYWYIGGINHRSNHTSTCRTTRAFDGDIRDVQVYDSPLSAAEIAALAGPAPTPIPTPWYVPQGAIPGKGVLNVVNCKLQANGLNSILRMLYPGGYMTPYPNLALYPFQPLVHYCDAYGLGNVDLYGVFAWGALNAEVGNEGWGRPPNYTLCDSVYYNKATWLFGIDVFWINPQPEDIILGDRSKSSATHGTSQYPAGYAPVPSFSVINVSPGTGTLAAAIEAAHHGDNLVLAPGTYLLDGLALGRLYIDKAIRIYGSTEDPDDVLITWTADATQNDTRGVWWRLYRMLNVPEPVRAPGMFHVTVRKPIEPYEYRPLIVLLKEDYDEDFNEWNPPQLYSAIMFSCNT